MEEGDKWIEKKLANMLVHRRYFAMCNFANRYVFASGGQLNDHPEYDVRLKSVERFSIRENKWEMLPSEMKHGMRRHSMCALEDSLYVLNS